MYYLKRILSLDYKKFFMTIHKCHVRSKKSHLFYFFDIVRCSRKFGSGYVDYYALHFDQLDDAKKATYITRKISNDYCAKMNKRSDYYLLEDKPTFLKTFHEFAKRDFVDLRECSYDDYLKFMQSHQEIIAKPVDQLCGIGIEKIVITEHKLSIEQLYDYFKNNRQFLLEECIYQDAGMQKLYDKALNTIRIVTLLKGDHVEIMFRAMRIGAGGNVVDNFNHGGIMTVLDENGHIKKCAIDKQGKTYLTHPDTNVELIGFEVPHFKELEKEAIAIAKACPTIRYVGWDLAYCDKYGALVIEGNHLPGYDIYQCWEHLEDDKLGLKPIFDPHFNS